MTGTEITQELEKRRGNKPSPGTIYPVLKDLTDKELLKVDQNKRYTLTKEGQNELEHHITIFFQTFCDIDEMKSCCHHPSNCHHK